MEVVDLTWSYRRLHSSSGRFEAAAYLTLDKARLPKSHQS